MWVRNIIGIEPQYQGPVEDRNKSEIDEATLLREMDYYRRRDTWYVLLDTPTEKLALYADLKPYYCWHYKKKEV